MRLDCLKEWFLTDEIPFVWWKKKDDNILISKPSPVTTEGILVRDAKKRGEAAYQTGEGRE
jgi:hypothetical protein